MKLPICIIFLTALDGLVGAAKLPPSFKTCKRSDTACLKQVFPDVIRQLTKPYPGVGLNTLDPYTINEIHVGAGTKGTLDFEQHYKNVKLNGLSKLEFDKIDLDFDKKKLSFSGVTKTFDFIGDYDFNGKILVIPLKGKGQFSAHMDNMKIIVDMDLDEFDKNGKKHFKVTDAKFHFIPEKIIFKLDNLFDGNKELGDNVNRVMNENWQALYDDLGSSYDAIFAQTIKQETNNLFSRVAIDDLFSK